MDSAQLRERVREVVSTLSFAWTTLKPEFLHTVHRMALVSSPATASFDPPLDPPVHDLVTNSQIRSSEMQGHLLARVVPSFLPAIQSIAEDELNDHFGGVASIYSRIESAVASGAIDRVLASRAHYWRITRNILAHGNGVISSRVVSEANNLAQKSEILFTSLVFWGPLLDAGQGGVPVPIVERAVAQPDQPEPSSKSVAIVAGNIISIGLADLLAAGDTWADVVKGVCGR